MSANKINDRKSSVAGGLNVSNYAATTAINSVIMSKKGSLAPAVANEASKLSNNQNFEFVNTSLMSANAPKRQGRNQNQPNGPNTNFARSVLMTPESGSRMSKSGNHFGLDHFEKKRGSVNIKDMKIQLNNARQRLKSQGHCRPGRNIMQAGNDHQGGFHSGFFQTQNADQWADIHISATKKQLLSSRDVRQVKTSQHKRSYSNDPSVMEMIQSGQKNTFNLLNPKFGVKGYSVQQTSMFEPYYKVQNITTSKRKNKENFIEEYIKQNSWKKPAQYDVLYDWTKTQPQWRGAFLKGPKISSTESVILENKRRPKPGPGIYPITNNIYDNLKKNSSKLSGDVKDCGFIEHSRAVSGDTPGHKYNKSYSVVDKKLKSVHIHKEPEKNKDVRLGKIGIDKSKPAMGDYDVTTAFKKSQLGNREYVLPKDKLQCYTDIYKNKKKFVPSPAAYKVELSAFDKLSASPVGIRVRRH